MAQNFPFFGGAHQQQQNATPVQQPPNQHLPQPAHNPAHPPPILTNGAPPSQAQQMAFHQNGALPTIPGMDLNAVLQNISPQQLALIAQLFQSGALTLPPPPPTGTIGTPISTSSAPPTPAAPVPSQAVPVVQARPVAQDQSQNKNVDKEEGEVEEGDQDVASAPRGHVITPLKAAGASAMESARRISQQPRQQPTAQHAPANGVSKASNTRTPSSKEAAVTSFILEMHKAGYTFDQIAKDVSNPAALRAVYQRLDLPVHTVTGTAAAAAPNASVRLPTTASERKPLAAKRPPPAKASNAQDRTAYLAKLQAAKNKKAEPTASSPTSLKLPIGTTVPPKPPQVGAAASPHVAAPSPTPAKAKPKTDLIRQRLEALKAERAAKQKEAAALSSDAVNPSSPSTTISTPQNGSVHKPVPPPGLGDGLVEAAERASRNATAPSSSPAPVTAALPRGPAVVSAASPTLNRGFGLPGLFTTGLPQSPVTPQPPPAALPRRPQSSLSGVEPFPQRQSRPPLPHTWSSNLQGTNNVAAQPVVAPESFIITDSDDESEDKMDIDDDKGHKPAIATLKQELARKIGSLQEASAQANMLKSSSSPGTPTAINENLQRSLTLEEQIEAMNRKIAEREQRQLERTKAKLQANATSGVATPVSEGATPAAEASSEGRAVVDLAQELSHEPSKEAGSRSAEVLSLQAEENEDDGFDDADLYDADDGVEIPTLTEDGKSGGQALAITAYTQPPATSRDTERPAIEHEEVQAADITALRLDTDPSAAQNRKTSQIGSLSVISSSRTTTNDSEDGIDDDDLDDIYDPPSASQHTNSTAEPSTATDMVDKPMRSTAEADEDEIRDEGDEVENDDSDDAMDTSDDSATSSEEDEALNNRPTPLPEVAMQETEPVSEPLQSTDRAAVDSDQTRIAADDDLAPELQPTTEELGVPFEEPTRPPVTFTPYESPLSRFKDFRYHSDFLNEVSGGFKSMTYSHKIDPNLALCPFETAGGICNDKNCPHQHFKSMTLSDNELLQFLGTRNLPVHSEEEDKKWKAGLAHVVRELRAQGQQHDVSAIARSIAEYRRGFIGDPTRTLMLD